MAMRDENHTHPPFFLFLFFFLQITGLILACKQEYFVHILLGWYYWCLLSLLVIFQLHEYLDYLTS